MDFKNNAYEYVKIYILVRKYLNTEMINNILHA